MKTYKQIFDYLSKVEQRYAIFQIHLVHTGEQVIVQIDTDSFRPLYVRADTFESAIRSLDDIFQVL